jgi:hypothetical protein
VKFFSTDSPLECKKKLQNFVEENKNSKNKNDIKWAVDAIEKIDSIDPLLLNVFYYYYYYYYYYYFFIIIFFI